MRLVIFGNSGSGKSSLARRLAGESAVALLELDNLVWEPGKIAVARPIAEVTREVAAFADASAQWIVEGCYGELVEQLLPHCTTLLFLNPGVEVCLAHNRARPWEPRKYASAEAQQSMLQGLLQWVEAYYRRDDTWSMAYHRALFDRHTGRKHELRDPAEIARFQPEQ